MKPAAEDVWIPTVCELCQRGPDLVKVHRVDGIIVNLEGNIDGDGFQDRAQAKGRLCPKPYSLIQKTYNPHRIKTPLKRTNPEKGRGVDPKWVEISWDEALETISNKLKMIRDTDTRRLWKCGGAALLRQSLSGTWDTFFSAFGPIQNVRGGATIRCDLAEHIFGNYIHGGFHCEPDMSYCNYVLIFGRNPSASGGVGENILYSAAKSRGAKIIVIDPVLTVTAAKADEWLPIRPGTDTAFLLAMIYVILHELDMYDEEFLKARTNSPYLVGKDGYFVRDRSTQKVLVWDTHDKKIKTYDDEGIKDFALEGSYSVDEVTAEPVFQVLKDHVRQYTPEWASAVTDIAANTIRRIAKEWVDNAQIGSTIKIDGVTLPYRPVATKLGRGLTGNMRSYQSMLANHILAALVGALEVVGGHGGGFVEGGTPVRGIIPGADGMLKMDAHPFTWPPVSTNGIETLVPYSKLYGHLAHLAYLNLLTPPKNFPLPPPPELIIRYRNNPLISVADQGMVGESLMKIPFILSISYVLDEMCEFSDMVLPEHSDLERYQLVADQHSKSLHKKFSGLLLRQPVIEPLYNTMDISDILTELASRTGFLSEYNQEINVALKLSPPYQLELNKKYEWIDIVDRHCKSATQGKHDLQWFKKAGALLNPVTARTQYQVHVKMETEKLRYPIPYMEHVKRTGEELAANLAKVGIDWWPTSEYVPLPIYVPPILEEVPAEYDFYLTTSRSMQFGLGVNVDIPWLIETAKLTLGQTDILMNGNTAKERGINNGDEVWVESEVGRVQHKVTLCQGIRPDTLLITHMFGQWAAPIAKDTGRVSQTSLVPIKHSWTDHVIGCMQGNTIKVKIYKV